MSVFRKHNKKHKKIKINKENRKNPIKIMINEKGQTELIE